MKRCRPSSKWISGILTYNRWKHLCHSWQDKGVPWNNIVAFRSSVNGSFMRERKKQFCSPPDLLCGDPELVWPTLPGCVCHLANRCCQLDVKQWPLSAWELLLGVSHHFQSCFKKKEGYKIYQVFKSIEAFKDCQALQHPLAQPPEVHIKDTAATNSPPENIWGVRTRCINVQGSKV